MKNNNVPGSTSDIPEKTSAVKNDIDPRNMPIKDKTKTTDPGDFANTEYTKWWIHRIKLA
jgi:hypothetical protein